MNVTPLLLIVVSTLPFLSCQHPKDSRRTKLSPTEAIDYLRNRGNFVSERSGGLIVELVPERGGLTVTERDIEAVNALEKVVEFRVIAFEGISPVVLKHLKVLPHVKKVAIHYQMPEASVAFLDRFPNMETLLIWGDHYVSFDQLPVLPKLRVVHHESTQGTFGMRSVQRIVACQNLEEVRIVLPLSERDVALLKTLPKWRRLEVNDTKFVRTPREGRGGAAIK